MSHRSTLILSVCIPITALLSACGGGGSDPLPAAVENQARLRSLAIAPATVRTPTNIETLQFRLDYGIDLQANTHLPIFMLSGHLLARGETLLSPDTTVSRVLSQACGQQGFACGDPFQRLCNISLGWIDPLKRRVSCDGLNLAMEVAPGEYQFVASICYFDAAGTRVCSSKSQPITFQ